MLIRPLGARNQKLIELATRGVERSLLLFGDPGPKERTAIVVYELEKERFGRLARELRFFLRAAHDFATEHP